MKIAMHSIVTLFVQAKKVNNKIRTLNINLLPNFYITSPTRSEDTDAARATTISGRLKNARTSAAAVPIEAVSVFPVL